jgi:hypothetical protein
LAVRADATKAKVGVRFQEENVVDDVGELVSAGVYHLVRNGASRLLVEVSRDLCVVMTPDAVDQQVVDASLDSASLPENTPLAELRRDSSS